MFVNRILRTYVFIQNAVVYEHVADAFHRPYRYTSPLINAFETKFVFPSQYHSNCSAKEAAEIMQNLKNFCVLNNGAARQNILHAC